MRFPLKNKRLAVELAMFALLAIAGTVYYWRYPVERPISTRSGQASGSDVRLDVPLHRQADPAWGRERLGNTTSSLSTAGCAVACVSMVFAYYGIEVTPGSLNAYLTDHEGYTGQGWIVWERCAECTGHRAVLTYVGNPKQALIEAQLDKSNPLIAKVYFGGGIAHWVVIVGKEGNEYLINDPLSGGDETRYLSYYGEQVYALRIFEKETGQ